MMLVTPVCDVGQERRARPSARGMGAAIRVVAMESVRSDRRILWQIRYVYRHIRPQQLRA